MSTSASYSVTPPSTQPADSGPVLQPAAPPSGRPRDFREYLAQLSPPFLAYPRGARLVGLMGLLFDALAEGAQLATLSRSLYSRTFRAEHALSLLGSERGLPRLPVESTESYRVRVAAAWRTWRLAGTEQGFREQLDALGLTGYQILANEDLDFDGHAEQWSRFFVVLAPPGHAWRPDGMWGDGQVWGDGGTWGSSASVAEVEAVRRVVRDMKPAHMRAEILVLFDAGALESSSLQVVGTLAVTHNAGVTGAAFPSGMVVRIASAPERVMQVVSTYALGVYQTNIQVVNVEGAGADATWELAPGQYPTTFEGLAPGTIDATVSVVPVYGDLSKGLYVTTTGNEGPNGRWDDYAERPENIAFWEG